MNYDTAWEETWCRWMGCYGVLGRGTWDQEAGKWAGKASLRICCLGWEAKHDQSFSGFKVWGWGGGWGTMGVFLGRVSSRCQVQNSGKAWWAGSVAIAKGNKKMLVENRLQKDLESSFYCLIHMGEYCHTQVMPATADEGYVIIHVNTNTHTLQNITYVSTCWVKNNLHKLF